MYLVISIHALLAESDVMGCSRNAHARDFYPRSPCGERPWGAKKYATTYTISIHALLAESDLAWYADAWTLPKISIHALLAESDSVTTSFQGGFAISIHALLAESDFRAPTQAL